MAEATAPWVDVPTRRARLTLIVASDDTVIVDVARRLSSLDVPNGPKVARVDLEGVLPPVPARPAKPADRSWWDDAHRRARAVGAHQAVLVAPDGSVIDGSTAAVWVAEGGVLVTPPAPPAIPSVSVAYVKSREVAAGLDVRVEPLSWERFEAGDEAFLTNAFGGAVPVRGRGGAGFSAVKTLFDEAWGTK